MEKWDDFAKEIEKIWGISVKRYGNKHTRRITLPAGGYEIRIYNTCGEFMKTNTHSEDFGLHIELTDYDRIYIHRLNFEMSINFSEGDIEVKDDVIMISCKNTEVYIERIS